MTTVDEQLPHMTAISGCNKSSGQVCIGLLITVLVYSLYSNLPHIVSLSLTVVNVLAVSACSKFSISSACESLPVSYTITEIKHKNSDNNFHAVPVPRKRLASVPSENTAREPSPLRTCDIFVCPLRHLRLPTLYRRLYRPCIL